MRKYILWFKEISKKDVSLVGGKSASLGEMISQLTARGILIPNGFALTTNAYWYFLKENKIDEKLKKIFEKFDSKDIKNLQETGKAARKIILKAEFPEDLKNEITKAYQELSKKYNLLFRNFNSETIGKGSGNHRFPVAERLKPRGFKNIVHEPEGRVTMFEAADVAVRTSGVVEDQPTMSFAGQFETFLNVRGEDNLLKAIKKCVSSTFTDRAIAYREEKKISQLKFGLSIGVQKMVRSDLASSGIMFTLDTETGFPNVVLINSIWGIGELIVKGKITPDEFYVFKPTLKQGYKSIIVKNLGRKTKKYVYKKEGGLKELNVHQRDQIRFSLSDDEVLTLAKWACQIEDLYKIPQDIEWAKDGKTGQLFIVQARPETVFASKIGKTYEEYEIKTTKKPILTGIAIGSKIGQGKVHIIPEVSKISQFQKGEVLVTKMTDPDWVAVFPSASAIVTDEGGSTCHAAIISRELGIPAIVGVQKATKILKNGQLVTVECSQGKEGRIFLGKIPYKIKRYDLKKIPKLKTKIMVNIGAPDIAFKNSFLPNDGVGLARVEFILAKKIRVHPLALIHYKELKLKIKNFTLPNFAEQNLGGQENANQKSKISKVIKQINEITAGHKDKKEYFIKELAEGIAQITAAFWPKEVIVRLSDLKTNEYRALIGGELFEPEEANPMLGFRGACRYLDKGFQSAFRMECQAIKRVRLEFGLKNVSVMIPFCRTPEEGKAVLNLLQQFGLGELKVYVMCEIPSNVILVDEFSKVFDAYSIGSNDLTQLLLGVDRDNAKISQVFDENNEAVKRAIEEFIKKAHQYGKKVGICGEAPASVPGFVEFLIKCGIDSISVNPDSVIKTMLLINKTEQNFQNSTTT